jgi:hypothetical protein
MNEVFAVIDRLFDVAAEQQRPVPGVQTKDKKVPALLRQVLERYPHDSPLFTASEKVLPLQELRVENDWLPFCYEAQGIVKWGIRTNELEAENPGVWLCIDEAKEEWIEDHESLSDFFITLAYWQALNGGWTVSAVTAESAQRDFTRLAKQLPKVQLPKSRWGLKLIGDDSRLACLVDKNDLRAAARTRDDFISLSAFLMTEWDYCSLEDEE